MTKKHVFPILAVALALVSGSLLAFAIRASHPRHEVFPGSGSADASRYYTFSDRKGGRSSVRILSWAPALRYVFILREGASQPFAGVGIRLASGKDQPGQDVVDLSSFDSLHIVARSSLASNQRVTMLSFVPGYTWPEDALTHRYVVQFRPFPQAAAQLSLPLRGFSIPSWWYYYNHAPGSVTAEKGFDRMRFLEFQSADGHPWGIADTVEISRIYLTGRRPGILYASLGGCALAWLLFFLALANRRFFEERRFRTLLRSSARVAVRSQKHVEQEKVLGYLREKYSDPELSIEKMALEVGINKKKISALLQDSIGNNFKTFLNELRLQEATRLLRETDLNITEIAFNVGYRNVTHFNRVFRAKHEQSPKEFRKEGAASSGKTQPDGEEEPGSKEPRSSGGGAKDATILPVGGGVGAAKSES